MTSQIDITTLNIYGKAGAESCDWTKYISGRQQYPARLYDTVFAYHRGDWKEVIDFGAGDCTTSAQLLKRFDHVEATDQAEEQLKLGQERLRKAGIGEDRLSIRVCEAGKHPGEAGSTDMVTASTCIHFFDVLAFMEDAARLLKPGGTLAVWTGGFAPYFVEAIDGKAKKSPLFDIFHGFMKAGIAPDMEQHSRRVMYLINLDNIGVPAQLFSDETRYNFHPPKGITFLNKTEWHDDKMYAVGPHAQVIDDIPTLLQQCAIYRDDFTFADLDNYVLTVARPRIHGPKTKRYIDTDEYKAARAKMVEVAGGEDAKMQAVFPISLILARKKDA